jgi:hypothetical protein
MMTSSTRSNEVNRSGDFYSVQLASGEVKKWTLDQLDAAYRASFIDEDTYVLPKGATSWSTLAEVVAAEPEPPSIAPPPVVADIDVDFDLGSISDDDDDLAALRRPKRRVFRTLVKLTAFAAIVGGVAFAAVKNPALVETVRTRATAMIAKPAPFKVSVLPVAAAVAAPPVALPQPVAASVAAPVVVPAVTPAPMVAMTTSGIPIVTAATEKAKPASKPEKATKKKAPARHKGGKTTTPFNKSGDAHDPLNGNL